MSDEGLLFYRCYLCRAVVSKWDVAEHFACAKCGHTKVSPCSLTRWEMLVQIVKHPMIWKWEEGENL